MSGIAAIIYWDGAAADKYAVGRMLSSVPHRAPDGSNAASGGNCSMGFARFCTTSREHTAVQPLHDEQHGIWLVADARLDNRDELNATLRGGSRLVPPDPELLALGYRRWGNGLAEHLAGDFAFVLWDERDRTLYAARDQFGVRPLFYHSNAIRLVFATEVAQILALRDFEWKIEDAFVIDYLAEDYRHERETFFRDIFRIVPGHYVVCKDRVLREERYWFPPSEELRLGRAEDYQAEFRRLFRQSVADRLESDGRPIIAHLSGGLDSGSIVCMADAIYGQDPATRPPLYTASALFPGLPCEETHLIDCVTRKVRFPSERWDGTVPYFEDLEHVYLADPTRDEQAGIFTGVYRLAAREGVRVVLSGDGGDQLLSEIGVFRDLAANHRWLGLFQEALSTHRENNRGWLRWVKDGIRNTAPQVLQRAYTSMRAKPQAPPPWVAPRLVESWPSMPRAHKPFARESWRSHTQQRTWNFLSSPFGYWNLEWQELGIAHRGLRIRYPFFDVRLARFVLAMPFEERLPGGKRKLLLRKSMEGLLPDEVAHCKGFSVLTSNVESQLRERLPLAWSVISDDLEWHSEPYIDRSEARKLVQTLASEGAAANPAGLMNAWNIAMLEIWLRNIRREFSS